MISKYLAQNKDDFTILREFKSSNRQGLRVQLHNLDKITALSSFLDGVNYIKNWILSFSIHAASVSN